MSNPLRLQGSRPVRVYPHDFVVWLSAVTMEEIIDIIGDEAFNKLMAQYEKELVDEEQVHNHQRSELMSALPVEYREVLSGQNFQQKLLVSNQNVGKKDSLLALPVETQEFHS